MAPRLGTVTLSGVGLTVDATTDEEDDVFSAGYELLVCAAQQAVGPINKGRCSIDGSFSEFNVASFRWRDHHSGGKFFVGIIADDPSISHSSAE